MCGSSHCATSASYWIRSPFVTPSSGQNGLSRFVRRTSRPPASIVAVPERGIRSGCGHAFVLHDALDRRQLRRALPVPDRAGDRHVGQFFPARTDRSSSPPRLMSPRPTKSDGNTRRSPKTPVSTSTYFADAMLPSSTTSQSGPISAASAPALAISGRRYLGSAAEMSTLANAWSASIVTAVSALRRPAFGVMTSAPLPASGASDPAAARSGARRRACP